VNFLKIFNYLLLFILESNSYIIVVSNQKKNLLKDFKITKINMIFSFYRQLKNSYYSIKFSNIDDDSSQRHQCACAEIKPNVSAQRKVQHPQFFFNLKT